jgi:hypothetical protein
MGASHSTSMRLLTVEQRRLETEGALYKTIGHVWKPSLVSSFAGSYNNALPLRRDNAPESYNIAWRVCTGEIEESALREFEVVVTVASDTGGSASHEMEVSSDEKLAHKGLTSITDAPNISRAHLLPDDRHCLYHWLPLLNLLSGHELDHNSHHPHRGEMGTALKSLAMNKLVLNYGNHTYFFDSLSKGILWPFFS